MRWRRRGFVVVRDACIPQGSRCDVDGDGCAVRSSASELRVERNTNPAEIEQETKTRDMRQRIESVKRRFAYRSHFSL